MKLVVRNFHLLLPALFILAALAVGTTFRYPLVSDDPFITYRYARNLLEGQGFVYNPGQPVLSTTAPLYALVLAAPGLVVQDIPALGFWLSVVSMGIAGWCMYLLAARFGFRAGGLAAGALVLLAPGLVLTFGLETGFYLALAFGALALYFHDRLIPAFVLLALLAITRSDGVLLAGLVMLHCIAAREDSLVDGKLEIRALIVKRWRPFAAFLLVLLPWLAFAWLSFGSPFPFTLTAKAAQAQSGLWDAFGSGLAKWFKAWLFENPLMALLAALGLIVAARKDSPLLLLALWVLAHLGGYTLLGVAFYPWYVAPLLAVAAFFAGLGLERAARWLARLMRRQAAAPWAVLAVTAVMLGLELRADLAAGMQRESPKVQVYRRAAEWLAQNTPGDASVDALEVGVIGYYDRRQTRDFVGLVDPVRVPYLRAGALAAGVRRASADYVVAIPTDAWLAADSWFPTAYQVAQEFRAPGFYGGKPLVIYRRADAGQTVVEAVPQNVWFGRWAKLTGVDLFSRTVKRGERLPLVLHLITAQPPPKSYKLTLQLVGAGDNVVAQTDTYFPTLVPPTRQPFLDHQALGVARSAAPGQYDLILALYDEESGDRVSLVDPALNPAGEFVRLGRVEIR